MNQLKPTHEKEAPGDDVIDDPLSQAMSMLDSLGDGGGDSNDFEDFAIDSDDDVNLTDLDLGNDDDLDLGSVDLLLDGVDGNGNDVNADVVSNGNGNGGAANAIGNKAAAVAVSGDDIQEGGTNTTAGAAGASSSATNIDNKVINIRAAIPPAYWATKQDVAETATATTSTSTASTGAVNSTTATSLPSNNVDPTSGSGSGSLLEQSHPLAHPLQNNSIQPTKLSTTATTTSDANPNSSWTSSFASFASRAAASVQTAVENAEAVAQQQFNQQQQHQQHGTVGHSLQHQQYHQQVAPQPRQQGGLYSNTSKSHTVTANATNANANNASSTTFGVVGVQGGAFIEQQPMTSKSIVMSYQERQKLLHQQYHAKSGGAGGGGSIPIAGTTPRASPATVVLGGSTATNSATTTTALPSSSGVSYDPLLSPQKPSSSAQHLTTAAPPPASTQASTPSTTATSTLQSHQPSSFLDKLTSSLDATTKTTLITSALGKLLPGERVIMFLNSLKDVKDSSFGHAFVGSDDLVVARGLGDVLLVNTNNNNKSGGSAGAGGGVGTFGEDGHGQQGDGDDVVTVWCCVMTFYRVAVFSYQAKMLDGKVLLDTTTMVDKGGDDDEIKSKEKEDDDDDVISQWIQSQNVSIQFQAAHYPSSKKNGRHHVFQMPLASIERVEKTLASSQRKAMAGGASQSTSLSTSSGYSSAYNAILPSSSTVSTASSAMVSLGSQMKVLGGIASSSSNSNLLTNGVGQGITASGTGGGGGMSSMENNNGPLGIILHGKDGGRTIQFSTLSYTDAQRAQEALNTYAFPGRRNLGYLFAFESRRAEVMDSNPPPGQQQQGQPQLGSAAAAATNADGNPIATAAKPIRRRFVPLEEYERQGIFSSRSGVYGPGYGNDGGVVSPIMSYASPWAPILNANASYGLCSTYPGVLVGPRSIVGDADLTNNISGHGGSNVSGHSSSANSSTAGGGMMDNGNIGLLRRCAAFRSENRFPVLTWGSSHHGGSIWRSSQPKVGLQGNRSVEDERYLYAIGEEAKRANLAADARAEGGVGGGTRSGRPPVEFLRMLCGRNNESDLIIEKSGVANSNSGCMLKIMDMRPKSAAMGNRTQGYGYENTNNYKGSTINFYGIGNIHAVRDAYQKVNALCLNPNTSDLQWMQLVENTNWPSMIRLILSASWQTAFHVHYNRLPVLVHCSHGWDRTSQVPALAQLFLDPHYRTREGFSTLVEKDFLSFGHPFHTRCGHGEGKNEQGGGDEGQLSPIFLQFLDCVFQLVNQFPNYFEFNTQYLLLLSEHIYSCRFGTLLCDSEREREVVAGIRQRTYCMWEYLDSIPELVNPVFDMADSAKAGVLLMPLPMLLRNVTLWTDRYCMYGSKATMPCVPSSLHHTYLAQSPNEQPMVLHTAQNGGVEGTMRRALEDVDMWKTTALAALKEVKELKIQQKNSEQKENGECYGTP